MKEWATGVYRKTEQYSSGKPVFKQVEFSFENFLILHRLFIDFLPKFCHITSTLIRVTFCLEKYSPWNFLFGKILFQIVWFWQNTHPEPFQIEATADINFLFKDSGSGYWHIGQEVTLESNHGSNHN